MGARQAEEHLATKRDDPTEQHETEPREDDEKNDRPRERPHTLLRLLRRLLLLRRLRGLLLLRVGAASASDPLDPQPGRGRSRCFWLGLAALSAALNSPVLCMLHV